MLLQHYVELFDTSIVDRITKPAGFSQQAYATVKQKCPGYPPLWDDWGAFLAYMVVNQNLHQTKSRSKAANNNGQDLHLGHLQQGHC